MNCCLLGKILTNLIRFIVEVEWREYLNPSFSIPPQQWPVETARSALQYYPICSQSIILNKTHPIAYKMSLIASKALHGQGTWSSLQSCSKCHLNVSEDQDYMNPVNAAVCSQHSPWAVCTQWGPRSFTQSISSLLAPEGACHPPAQNSQAVQRQEQRARQGWSSLTED